MAAAENSIHSLVQVKYPLECYITVTALLLRTNIFVIVDSYYVNT